MKLVYLANLRLPTEKAYGIQIAKMCEAFANNGHQVKLLYPYRKNPSINQDIFSYYSIKNNFETKEVKSKDFYFPGFLDKIAFIIKNYFSANTLIKEALKEDANIYYTRDEHIAYILNKQNKNVVFECHRFSNKKKTFYPHLEKIVTISDGLKEDLIKNGIEDSKMLVARDGVDLEEFNVDISKEESRDKFNLPQDKKILLYTGHLFAWKGADVLAQAAKSLSEVLFVFVGGTDHDVGEFKKKYNFSNTLILGHRPHNDIPVLLKAADILVLPNRSEEAISSRYTSPLKLFEYMASGRPIIASDLPSIREVLNENNALLVAPNNPKLLAEKIEFLLSREDLQFNLSSQAFELVKGYTWLLRAERIATLF